jgi:hypothetical protein
VEYVEVKSESCETFGYATITDKQDCIDAAIFVGRTITWGPHGGYNDVVTGCSARFSITNTNLFFQQPGICDPTANIDGWSYTGCKCADWMPCLCRVPMSTPSVSPTYVTSTLPSLEPSENRYKFCNPGDVTGKIFFASGGGFCFKIVVGVGGQIIGDNNDPTCENKSGTGIPFSNFDGFTGNTLNWKPQSGFSGTMKFLEKTVLTEPKLAINSLQAGVFDVTLELPSCLMTEPPSPVPSIMPSSIFCSADDVSGAEYFANIAGHCFKIELIDNVGKLIGDRDDPNCETKSGTGIPFSNFDGFNGNMAVWSTGAAGFSGTMTFKRDPTVTKPELINNGLNGQVFDVTLILPSCQQTP